MRRSAAAQELQITSLDQGYRLANEAVRFATRMRILPLDRTALGVVGAEHLRRNISRAAAQVMDVEGMKELDQAPFLKRRQPQGRRQKSGALASKTADEVESNLKPQFGHAVDRQEHGGTLRSLLVPQADMEFTRLVCDHQFTSIGIGQLDKRQAEGVAIDGFGDIEAGRRRLQDQCSRRDLGQP
ncbi:hypothetical protein AOQ71_02885 [Bradyrhizobium manausense]|uniref:Uncharacterized protein n=1 Tax=Bradyrhizobium manausense TaxID=989370 RepID=A0A0R3E4M4_9BRAD|nr:hypothetical protein AOQ71_02885 [Bradyrhizobium manausense]